MKEENDGLRKDVESIEMENDTLREDLGSVERKLAEP